MIFHCKYCAADLCVGAYGKKLCALLENEPVCFGASKVLVGEVWRRKVSGQQKFMDRTPIFHAQHSLCLSLNV